MWAMLLFMLAQDPSRTVALAAFRSPDWSERADTYRAVLASPDLLEEEQVRQALVELLAFENGVIADAYREGVGVSRKFGEEYSEYYDGLLATVSKRISPSDPATMSALAQASYNPDSPFATELAEYGEAVVTPLLAMATHKMDTRRWNSIEMLGKVLGADHRKRSKVALTVLSRDCARMVIRDAAFAKDAATRLAAINALVVSGELDALPLLQHIADSDAAATQSGRPSHIREAAIRAINQVRSARPR